MLSLFAESSKYPKYENELDNYSQKIRSKLEDFQKARREWTKWSDKPKEVSINVEKEEWTTSYYNGRLVQ